MQLMIDGIHEQALLSLQDHNGQPTAISMVRQLIRDEAKQHGLWPSNGNGGQPEPAPVYEKSEAGT